MHLGQAGSAVGSSFDGATSSALLTLIANEEVARRSSEVRTWRGIVAWAENNLHEGPSERQVDDVVAALDTGVELAGEGAPLVSEFAVMELIAVLGRTPESGRDFIGRILECAWRLPNVYAAVVAGRLAPWRAARIADHTLSLNAEAAAYVDRQLFDATKVSWAQLDRLVAEAVIRFDPETAEAERQRSNSGLHVHVSTPDRDGKVYLDATLDAADGADLDAAVGRRAELRKRLGDDAGLDERRARGLGDLARADLELDLLVADETTGEVKASMPGRRAEVIVHITPGSLTGENPVGRWNHRPVSTEQIREWVQSCSHVTVRPVIDLADCDHVDSYEIPDRINRQVVLRDHRCRFPDCTIPAQRCDVDHRTPHREGGATCPCNLTPLCRKHHRAKTHARWSYVLLDPGIHQWTSPTGRGFTVTPRGTYPRRE